MMTTFLMGFGASAVVGSPMDPPMVDCAAGGCGSGGNIFETGGWILSGLLFLFLMGMPLVAISESRKSDYSGRKIRIGEKIGGFIVSFIFPIAILVLINSYNFEWQVATWTVFGATLILTLALVLISSIFKKAE